MMPPPVRLLPTANGPRMREYPIVQTFVHSCIRAFVVTFVVGRLLVDESYMFRNISLFVAVHLPDIGVWRIWEVVLVWLL